MRCQCCNALLTDYEATKRHAITKEFLDLCSDCFSAVNSDAPIPYRDRPELWGEYDSDEDVNLDVDSMDEL